MTPRRRRNIYVYHTNIRLGWESNNPTTNLAVRPVIYLEKIIMLEQSDYVVDCIS